jgi:hypothetical protein
MRALDLESVNCELAENSNKSSSLQRVLTVTTGKMANVIG